MPTRFQAASGHRTRGQQVPTLRLLASIWNAMPMTAGKVKLDQPFNASSLLPRNLRYYRFAGSLTTPLCTEGVSWLVLKSYDHIDQAQAEKFARAVGSHNNRPVQPLNARVVIE